MRWMCLIVLAACAPLTPAFQRPDWVSAVRNGDEALRVPHGGKTYYRRIAGGPTYSKQTSCDWAVQKAQEDIRAEYAGQTVSNAVEVVYYDLEHRDCAVTLSVGGRPQPVTQVEAPAPAQESSDLLQQRSRAAVEHALTGLKRDEFERFVGDEAVVTEQSAECQRAFRTPASSTHGVVQVCWRADHVVGYCTGADRQCWTRTTQP